MEKEYFKTQNFGSFIIKFFATPTLDKEDCKFGFDVSCKDELFCTNCECNFSQSNTLFDNEEDIYEEAKECIKFCLTQQDELLEYANSNYIEEYPEDFEIKKVNN